MSTEKVIRGDGDVSMDGAVNAEHYDALADDYDRQLREWGYEAPEQGAKLLAEYLPDFEHGRILDCGCGTGMTGQALRDTGANGPVIGADVSTHSLELAAAKGVYAETRAIDLNTPLPFEQDHFDGVLCIGVLSYVEAEPVFREWLRVVRPGGVVVFTSREDFFASRDYMELLNRLEDEGKWVHLEVTDPKPYLPAHEEFADTIGVFYCVYQIT